MTSRIRLLALSFGAATLAIVTTACDDRGGGIGGSIRVDGSSTVFPITEAVAEEFLREQRSIKVTVGLSGTGGGFQKFCNGETDISNASRPISKAEIDRCAAAGIEFIELPVAYDAISVVVNPKNDWVDCISVPELKKMWEPAAQGAVTRWEQVNPAWAEGGKLGLFGPGTDSGTFDYFTEHVMGKARDSRGDFTASEDDNVLVTGISGNRSAIGYFGLAYYLENQSRVRALKVSQEADGTCVEPTPEAVESGEYPLARALFIYVRKDASARPEVRAFVDFYLENAGFLATDVGYVQFPDAFYTRIRSIWGTGTVGSLFSGKTGTVKQILGIP